MKDFIFDTSKILQSRIREFCPNGIQSFYDSYFNAVNLRVKVARCKECENVFVYHVKKRPTKYNHKLCTNCWHKAEGKKIRDKQQKQLKEKIGREDLDLFFNDFYPYILKELENKRQDYQDLLHKYLLNIVWAIKDCGILSNGNKISAKKVTMAYLNKAIKRIPEEKNFSDLSFGFHRRLGLNFGEE